MKKKVFAILLAVCLFFCTLFMSYETAEASALAITADVGVEILSIFFSILMTGLAASGGTDSYIADLIEYGYFREQLMESGFEYFANYDGWVDRKSMQILMNDGTLRDLTGEEFYQIYSSTAPDKFDEIYDNWKVLQGGGGSPGSDNSNGSGKLLGYILTPEMLTGTQNYIKELFSGAIDGIDVSKYAGSTVTHTLEARDGSGKTVDVELTHYFYGVPSSGIYMNALCVCDGTYMDGTAGEYYVVYDTYYARNLSYEKMSYAYLNGDSNFKAIFAGYKFTYGYNQTVNRIREIYDTSTLAPVSFSELKDLSGSTDFSSNCYFFTSKEPMLFYTNLPCFSSSSDHYNYYYHKYDSMLERVINGIQDYETISSAVVESLSGLAGETLKPDAMVDIYNSIDAAADNAQKNGTALSPETYPDAVTDAVSSTLPDIMVDPATVPTPAPTPEPEPEPEPEPDPDPEQKENVDKYKRDLTMIFPFCIPFDFVRLLETLDAEPVAPSFEFPVVVEALDVDMKVDISLAWLEDVMVVFRTGETVSFVLLLMVNTRKLIKW